MKYLMGKVQLAMLAVLLASGSANAAPQDPNNICTILAQNKGWYTAAVKASQRWELPMHIGLAFIHRESSFVAKAKPPRKKVLGIVPWRRSSSAYGYAQATDEAWKDYKKDTGRRFVQRDDFADALDGLTRLPLAETQQREIPRVLLECCLQETAYNPYYETLAAKLCERAPKKHRLALQLCVWDHVREVAPSAAEGRDDAAGSRRRRDPSPWPFTKAQPSGFGGGGLSSGGAAPPAAHQQRGQHVAPPLLARLHHHY